MNARDIKMYQGEESDPRPRIGSPQNPGSIL